MKDWKVSGFTLVEILVVLAVAGIVTMGLFNFMVSQSRSYIVQEEIKEMELNARLALEIISKRLIESAPGDIDPDPNGNASNGPFAAGDDILIGNDRFSFMQMAGDTSVDTSSSNIWHTNNVSGDTLWQIAYFITQDSDGVTTTPEIPIFTYDNPANPRVVTVTIVARTRNTDPRYSLNGGYRQMVLTKRVLLRNPS